MDSSVKAGISFGLTSGTITTLGLMVGLDAGTSSQIAVTGGVLTIAIADAFSDALGEHISQESENQHSAKEIWLATISTFFTKLLFALTFLLPVVLLPLSTAVLASVVYGMGVLAIVSFFIAKQEKETVWKVILEHVSIAIVVVIASFFVGSWIKTVFLV